MNSRYFVSLLKNNSRTFSTFKPIQAQKQFVVILKDFKDPDCLQRRIDARGVHLKNVLQAKKDGIINLGGPILDNHISGRMEGSFLVVSAESSQEIETMILNDPYYKGKVWEKWEIFPADIAIGSIGQ